MAQILSYRPISICCSSRSGIILSYSLSYRCPTRLSFGSNPLVVLYISNQSHSSDDISTLSITSWSAQQSSATVMQVEDWVQVVSAGTSSHQQTGTCRPTKSLDNYCIGARSGLKPQHRLCQAVNKTQTWWTRRLCCRTSRYPPTSKPSRTLMFLTAN